MRILFFVVALAAFACGPPPPCTPSSTGVPVVDPGGVEGQSMTVNVPSGLFVPGCKAPTVTSVTVSVQDPDDQLVPNTVNFTPTDVDNASAQVTFTPPRAGHYHLIVRFDPSFGTRQAELLVARDRADAGFHTVPAPANCAAFFVAGGVPLCHDPSGRLLGAYLPDGGVHNVQAAMVSVDDQTQRIWGLGTLDAAGRLQVYSLQDGAFVQLAASFGANETPTALVARGDRALLIRQTVAELWELDAGALDVAQTLGLTSNGSRSTWCATFAPPARWAAFDVTGQQAELAFDGVEFQSTFTAFGVSNNLAADDDGVWWTDGTSLNVQRAPANVDAGVTASIPYPGGFFLPMTGTCVDSQQSPILQTNQLVPVLGPEGISYDKFPAAAGTLLGATSRVVWGIDQGQLFWWDR